MRIGSGSRIVAVALAATSALLLTSVPAAACSVAPPASLDALLVGPAEGAEPIGGADGLVVGVVVHEVVSTAPPLGVTRVGVGYVEVARVGEHPSSDGVQVRYPTSVQRLLRGWTASSCSDLPVPRRGDAIVTAVIQHRSTQPEWETVDLVSGDGLVVSSPLSAQDWEELSRRFPGLARSHPRALAVALVTLRVWWPDALALALAALAVAASMRWRARRRRLVSDGASDSG